MSATEPNLAIDGDDARILMNALVTSDSHAPTGSVLKLYLKLNQISMVQPHMPEVVAAPVPEPAPEPPAETPRKRTRKTR